MYNSRIMELQYDEKLYFLYPGYKDLVSWKHVVLQKKCLHSIIIIKYQLLVYSFFQKCNLRLLLTPWSAEARLRLWPQNGSQTKERGKKRGSDLPLYPHRKQPHQTADCVSDRMASVWVHRPPYHHRQLCGLGHRATSTQWRQDRVGTKTRKHIRA